jgi:hypothetical protein
MSELTQTRRALHGVAEYLLAGPQYRTSGTIRLRAFAGGFATVAAPDVRVTDGDLVVGAERVAIDGATLADLATRAGLDGGTPSGLYSDGSGVGPQEQLVVDPVSAAKLAEAYAVGDAALRALDDRSEPVIWPEHFDIGVRLDEVNYGVSPGDAYLDEPYAYVGVDPVPSDPFWNAPFGAVRPLAEFPDADAVASFFAEGRTAAHG